MYVYVSQNVNMISYGSFIFMNIQHATNDTSMLRNPTHIRRTLLSFGVDGP